MLRLPRHILRSLASVYGEDVVLATYVTRRSVPAIPNSVEGGPFFASENLQVLETIFDDRAWGEWGGYRGGRLTGDGGLRRMGPWRLCGTIRMPIHVLPGECYRLTLEANVPPGEINVCCSIRDQVGDDTPSLLDENQTPVVACTEGVASITTYFQTFSTTKTLKIFVFLRHIRLGERIQLNRVALERVKVSHPRLMLDMPEKVMASLASIPSRAAWLQDTVMSLLPQVDELCVYLNGYEEVPEYLQAHDRVRVLRSQEEGDHGDAGKFFWGGDPTPGYRFLCDDDIVYPIDYVHRLIARLKHYRNRVLIGVHGSVLKQPLENYYAPASRYTLGIGDENSDDFSCHLLGTGTLAYHTHAIQLNVQDFPQPNMADVWLAKVAEEQGIPRVCVAREENWLIPRVGEIGGSIYEASSANAQSRMNTRDKQNTILQELAPLSLTMAAKVTGRKKLIFAVKTFGRLGYLKNCLRSFEQTCSRAYDWVVVVADDGSTDGTLVYLESLKLPFEMHIIRNQRRYAVGQCNTVFSLSKSLGFDAGFMVDDDLVFRKPGWEGLYLKAMEASGYDHLCFLDHTHYVELHSRHTPDFEMPTAHYDPSRRCAAHVPVRNCMGALFTFTPKMIEAIGGADEVNFPVRGHWHIDLSQRACRAQLNDEHHFYDAAESNEYLMLQNDVEETKYRGSIDWEDKSYERVRAAEEVARRDALLVDAARVFVAIAPGTAPESKKV